MILQKTSINLASNPACGERRFEFEEGEPVLSDESAKSSSAASDLTTSALMKCQRRISRSLKWKKPIQDILLRPITKATRLRHDIENRTYQPHKLQQKRINERGKVRWVRPPTARDRTIQTWLCDEYLTPMAMERMIPTSYACIKGRGLDAALDAFEDGLRKAPADAWCGQFDLKSYFASIVHEKLIAFLLEGNDDELIDFLIRVTFENNVAALGPDGDENPGIGLELGACTSQVGATMFPNRLDRDVKNSPGCLFYARYMDDGIFLSRSREDALRSLSAAHRSASDLGLQINEKKTHVNRVTHPIVFCKHRFEKSEHGVVRHVRAPQIRRMQRHIRRVEQKSARSPTPIDMTSVIASYIGYLQRDNGDLLHFLPELN